MDQVQVFYNEDENAVPLETDSALELANIQKSIGGPLKKSYLTLLVLSLFQLGFGLWRLVRDPVDNIGNSSSLLSTGAYLPLSVLILWGFLAYRRWLRKAWGRRRDWSPSAGLAQRQMAQHPDHGVGRPCWCWPPSPLWAGPPGWCCC